MTGTIKKLHDEKRFGFIVSNEDGKDYFFHGSGLINLDWNNLSEGMMVKFVPTAGPKGPRAESIERV